MRPDEFKKNDPQHSIIPPFHLSIGDGDTLRLAPCRQALWQQLETRGKSYDPL
jgi:hypothetical protein